MDKFYEKNMADEGTSTNGKNLHGVKIVCQKKKKHICEALSKGDV